MLSIAKNLADPSILEILIKYQLALKFNKYPGNCIKYILNILNEIK